MQIRIANRQDEKKIRALVESIAQEFDRPLDLDASDQDLKNVEANYFGRDGIFLVAEEDKEIVALAGASKSSDEICVLRRICVASDRRRQGIGRALLAIILGHADRMGFAELVLADNPYRSKGSEAKVGVDRFFSSLGILPASSSSGSVEKNFGGKFIFTQAR